MSTSDTIALAGVILTGLGFARVLIQIGQVLEQIKVLRDGAEKTTATVDVLSREVPVLAQRFDDHLLWHDKPASS